MSIIISILKDELDRNLRMQEAYSHEIGKFSKGKILIKTIKNHNYVYRLFRNELGKVVFEYIGPQDKVDLDLLHKQEMLRKENIAILKRLKLEQRNLEMIIKDSERRTDTSSL